MRAILMAVVLATMAACSGGGDLPGDDTEPTCAITEDRGRSCSRVCSAFTPADLPTAQLCSNATWDVCVDECMAGVSGVGWCP